MKVVLDITKEDIQQGKRGNPWTCPVARALSRELHSVVIVGLSAFGAEGGPVFALPPAVSNWIQAFDRRQELEPFHLEWETTLALRGYEP